MDNSLYSRINSLIESNENLNDSEFNDLALAVFEWQFKHNSIYQQICHSLKKKTKPQNWQEIPYLTNDLFKTHQLFCKDDREIVQIFYSSGTTSKDKSKHYFSERQLKLYEQSLWKSFSKAFKLTKNNLSEFNYFILSSSLEESPNSSLIYMFETIRQKVKVQENYYFIEQNTLQSKKLIEEIQKSNKPIFLLGTAFSFINFLENNNISFNLPSQSAIMETGGFKGKSREIPKQEFYTLLSNRFGLPLQNIIGQYGMSELGTQYYDESYSLNSNQKRLKKNPNWARTRIMKNSMEEASEGEIGLICHYDLSNIDSLAFILSGDLGIKRENNSFEIIGRSPNLSLRGCSLTNDI